MESTEARFEFRIWAPDLSAVRSRMESLAKPGAERSSDETYILSSATDTANVKIRGGQIDIKVLAEVADGLERWRPVLKAGFPLEARVLIEQAFPALEVPPPALKRSAYTLAELIGEAVASVAALKAVDVSKRRYGFEISGCTAEYAKVAVMGAGESDTVAVESVDRAAMRQAIAALGLSGRENVNYLKHLKGVSGIKMRPNQ